MKTAIIMKADGSIASNYEGAPDQSKYGGPWGDVANSAHVQIPDGLDLRALVASEGSDGVWAIAANSALAASLAASDAKAKAIADTQADRDFGDSLVTQFAAENRTLGITAAGKSSAVLTTMAPIMSALDSGSLDVAVAMMKAIPTASYDSKFITAARILSYVNMIETHLGETLSTSLS
jgi:hypothetical protein